MVDATLSPELKNLELLVYQSLKFKARLDSICINKS